MTILPQSLRAEVRASQPRTVAPIVGFVAGVTLGVLIVVNVGLYALGAFA